MSIQGAVAAAARKYEPYRGALLALDFRRGEYWCEGRRYREFGHVPGATFSRASTRYKETAAGLLVPVASGVPGITDKGLLVEEARTNLFLRSQEFDNGVSWSNSNLTVTANATTAPDGTLTADKLEVTTSAGTQSLQTVTAFASTSGVMSVYGKIGSGATDGNKFAFYNLTTATVLLSVTINWTTGAITHVTGSGATSQAMAGGWWRIILPVTSGITSGDNVRLYAVGLGGAETAGEFCYLWGAQLEAGAFPTSYIPTTSASATRAADVASLALASATTGTFISTFRSHPTNAYSYVVGATAGYGPIVPDSTPRVTLVGTTNLSKAVTFAANERMSAGMAWDAAGRSVTAKGAAVATDAGAVGSWSTIYLGSDRGTGFRLNNYVEKTLFYPPRFTDAQLQAATT